MKRIGFLHFDTIYTSKGVFSLGASFFEKQTDCAKIKPRNLFNITSSLVFRQAMNNENHTIGIDIGTQAIKIIITDITNTNEPRIIHAIESQSHGIRNGYIVDAERSFDSITNALKKAEREYKQKITKARFVIGGIGLESFTIKTSLTIQKKNSMIDDSSIQEIIQKSEELFLDKYPNKKVLHIIPVKYRVDDHDVLGTPIGMYGSTLELKVIFITILEHHYEAFFNLIDKTGVQIQDIQALPLADAMGALSYRQKTQGCILVNVGSETTALSIFENGILTSLEILGLGSNDITNDLALGLKIPLQEAERTKTNSKHDFPKRTVEEIIHARIIDILELVGRHLSNLKKNRLLPAGIIFSGGGSQVDGLCDYAKSELSLPAELVSLGMMSRKTKRNMRLPHSFSAAYGVCFGLEENAPQNKSSFSFSSFRKGLNNFFKQMMP